MTVREVIAELLEMDQGANVYVPDLDGTAQICKRVSRLVHVHLPEGTAMSDDVTLLPQSLVDDGNEQPQEDA